LQDHGVVAIEEIDESVFLADASRPAAGEGVAQRLGFTDALKGVTEDFVDDNPRPELRPASDEHGTDARLVSRLRDAREFATVVVFHVQIGVQVNENHLSEPPSGSQYGLIIVA